jgi:hypothetical protein
MMSALSDDANVRCHMDVTSEYPSKTGKQGLHAEFYLR